jgi:RNA polymerase sigma-70 factor (ECF subfamily)
VARTLGAWARQQRKLQGVTVRRVDVNGQPGAVVLDAEGRVFSVLALEIGEGHVQGVRSIVNPDKLGHLGPVADMRAVLEARDR